MGGSALNGCPHFFPRRPIFITILPVACLLLSLAMASHAIATTEVSAMTDQELMQNFYREDVRNEFHKRLEERSSGGRQELLKLYENRVILRKYPQDFTDQELVERLPAFQDVGAFLPAQKELAQRYRLGNPDEQRAIVELLQSAFTPVSQDGDDSAVPGKSQLNAGLALAVGKILPESEAVDLFYEVYVESNESNGITTFLRSLEVAGVRGQHTAKVLGKLYTAVHGIEPEPRRARGEDPELELMILPLLGRCGKDAFEELKKVNWSDPGIGVQAMGAIGTLDARDELLGLYAQCSDELSDRRLTILSALTNILHFTDDEVTRNVLRQELSKFLMPPTSVEEIGYCGRAAEIAANTRDLYFLDVLRALQQGPTLDGLAVGQASTDTGTAEKIQRFESVLSRSIDKLEVLPE